MSENQEEYWYKNGLRFGCRQCGGCCTGEEGFVWVTEEDIAALAKVYDLSPYEFEVNFVRLVEGKRKSLREFPNGDCVLFNRRTRKCMVYDIRPIQCRTWPFWEQNIDCPNSWKKTARFCKGCNNPQGQLYTIEEIRERAEKTFDDFDYQY